MHEPGLLLDRYEVGEPIGAGGASRVHLGHDRVLNRRVAIKLLDADRVQSADPAGHARFLREGRSAARFSHPHAVTTYDAGEDDGRLFIVMEYVDGPNLAQHIADHAPMDEAVAVRIATQVLGALGAAHAAGLIHRDVKPANVVLDRSGNVKLADFGIARRFDEMTSALTVDGMVIGTRGYLAPEQARGLETGPAVDIYAVGALLYEMVTGQRAPMTDPHAVQGVDPRSHRPELSPALAAAVSTALAGEPSARFDSAETMTMALDGRLPATALALPLDRAMAPVTSARTATAPAGAMPGGSSPTVPMTSAPTTHPPDRGAPAGLIIGLLVLVAVALGIAALASRDSDQTTAVGTTDTTSAPLTEAITTSVPPDSPPTTTPVSITTPQTQPSTTPPPPPPAELIPGFPATDDFEQFIETLRDNKEIAGKQSRKLGDQLRDVSKADEPEKRAEEIDKAVDKIDEWLEEGEIDPTVAARALEFLAEIQR